VQLARLVLEHGRPMRGGDRFVVRGSATAADASVTCGGTVIDAVPHPRSRGELRRELVRAVRAADAKGALAVLLQQVAPRPLDLPALSGRLGIDQASLAREAEAQVARGELVSVGSGVLARAVLLELADQARKLVADHARRAPLDRGLPVATLQQKLAQRAGVEAADVAIRAARARRSAADSDLIAIEGDVAVVAHKARAVDPRIADAVETARGVLATAGMHGASLGKVGEVTAVAADQARAMLAFLERQGAAVRAGDLWFSRDVVDQLRERLVRHLEGSGSVTVIEFKSLGDVPRKQAVLLLEHFDQVGLTRRKGDVRILARER
jgi:selenocysteine-specific elongation factor